MRRTQRYSNTSAPRNNRNNRDEVSYLSEDDYSDDFDRDSVRSDRSVEYTRKRSPVTEQSHRTVTAGSSGTRVESRRPKKKTAMYGNGNYNQVRARSLTNNQVRRPSNNKVQERVMSARRNRINQLHNEMSEMRTRCEELNKENRLLKTLQHRQGKALRKLEDTESNLPRLLSQHQEEQRVLKMRLRKAQDRERQLESKVRSLSEEQEKLENQLKRYKKLVNERNLAERDELARNLSATQDKLLEVERRNQELVRNMELNTQSYLRQIRGERQKHQNTKAELQRLTDDNALLQNKLKEKERQLDVNNIYSLRGRSSIMEGSKSSSSVNNSMLIATERSHVSSKHNTPRREKPKQPPLILATPSQSTTASASPPSVLSAMPAATRRQEPPVPKIEIVQEEEEEEVSNALKPIPVQPAFFTEASALSSTRLNDSVAVGDQTDEVVKEMARQSLNSSGREPEMPSVHEKLNDELMINKSNSVVSGIVSDFEKMEEEARAKEVEAKKKLEEEQLRRKAALLAKMRQIDEQENDVTPREGSNTPTNMTAASPPPSALNHLKAPSPPSHQERLLHSSSSTVTVPDPNVEHLHRGIPSKVDKELSFGSYSPSAQPNPRRRGRPVAVAKRNDNTKEADEPLFDLNSGRQSKKSENLLNQLFGGEKSESPTLLDDISRPSINNAGGKIASSTTANKNSSAYPWEKNVVTAKVTNGSGDYRGSAADRIIVSPITKARPPVILDDDIEELAL